jgi:phosphorylase kinase alpha/beta subunit
LAVDLGRFLQQNGTFHFPSLRSGLFPAVGHGSLEENTSGYKNVWVRDNIYTAFAHFLMGEPEVAHRTVTSLARYFRKYKRRFVSTIEGDADPSDPMQRPHVRFDGERLQENKQKWAHAQNDALGYFLWLYCKLIDEQILKAYEIDSDLLIIFPEYLNQIQYWQDEDSGHWEETRKISASSIGVATAGLKELKKIIQKRHIPFKWQPSDRKRIIPILDSLIDKGVQALKNILPAECAQEDPKKNRPYDAALLFLIYPTELLDGEIADRIIERITSHLQGEYGIRRYLGDSYWAANYRRKLAPSERTVDFSSDIDKRDTLIKPGEEAQWCIFDPILSVIYGKKFQKSGNPQFQKLQTHYFNRSLSQITGEGKGLQMLRCPEAYFLENDRYVPNDHCPLLWTQANLLMAFNKMLENRPGV